MSSGCGPDRPEVALVISLPPAGSSPLSQVSLLQKGDFSSLLSVCYREVPFPRRGSGVALGFRGFLVETSSPVEPQW